MRTCYRCKEGKELSEFHKRGDGHQYLCKSCRKIVRKEHYDKNIDKYHELSKIYSSEKRKWLKEYKTTLFCIQCGETHPACLEFHHRNPNEKKFEISECGGRSKERVLLEIAKCNVLCANCHRKLHWD